MAEPHSETYKAALGKNFIREIKEADGATYFEYSVLDASAANVINADGLVIIDNTLHQYTPTGIKTMPYAGSESINAIKEATVTIGDITVTNLIETSSNGKNSPKVAGSPTAYNWSQGPYENQWRYWNNNKKRVRMYVTGYSSASGTSAVSNCVYNLTLVVQKKNASGNWVYGDPTYCYLNSSWVFRFGLQKNSVPFQCTTFHSLDLSPTSVSHSYSQNYWPSTNYLVLNLTPNGILNANGTGYDVFCDAVDVWSYHFNGSICCTSLNSLDK